MESKNSFFIEIASLTLCENGQSVPGVSCLQNRAAGRTTVVMSDGGITGVKGNVISRVIGSMAINYALAGEHAGHAARTVIRTFESSGGHDESSFAIADIRRNGNINIAKCGSTEAFLIRDRKIHGLYCSAEDRAMYMLDSLDIAAQPEDRLILISRGVWTSGRMSNSRPDGWSVREVEDFCVTSIEKDSTISAQQLCKDIIQQAEGNDHFIPKNDMGCTVVYFRQPRRIIISTGPPFNEHKDEILADMVNRFEGTKMICGGTTAQIISRELKKDLSVKLKRDPAGLPPTSVMEGIDLVTEGVMTLSKAKTVLAKSDITMPIENPGTDGVVARMLLDHDIIHFVVGTRINPLHQDPNLPIELELRRNLIRDLAYLLENKYMKEVKVQFI